MKLYFEILFLVLCANPISALLAAIGIRGFAFYHLQSILLGILLLHAGILLLGGRIRFISDLPLGRLALASICYTAVSGLLLLRFADVVPGYVALMVYTWTIYPLTALVILGCEPASGAPPNASGDSKFFSGWLAWGAVGVLLFGWLQYFAKQTFIHVSNAEGESKLVETNAFGSFRPPSVFGSSFQYGMFAVLVFCLAAPKFRKAGVGSRLITLLAAASVVLSQTRNAYVAGICALVSIVLLRRTTASSSSKVLVRALPVVYLAISVAVALFAFWSFLDSGMQKSGNLADTSSTMARVSGWLTAWETVVKPGNMLDLMFGYGITQAGHASDHRTLYPARAEGLFIDSTFVNIFLFQGLIGLGLFLLTYWTMWRRLLRALHPSDDPALFGLACFTSAFLAAGVMNILSGQWWGISLSLVLAAFRGRQVDPTAGCAA